MDRKIRFLQPAKHTDDEITAFLQSMAEKGWWLKKVKGNYFTFIRRPYSGHRICARTFFTVSAELPTETQLRKELPRLRREGWDMIAIGGVENIADTRRHAYLYEEKPDSENPIPLPEVDKDQVAFSMRRGKRKAASGLFLSLLYALFFGFVLSSSLTAVLTGNFYLISAIAFSLLLVVCLALSLAAFASVLRSRRDSAKEIKSGRYRILDHATALLSLTLLILCLFLAFDYFYSNRGKQSEKIKIGSTSVEIFSDEVPIKLENLGIEIRHPYRSTRREESSSFLASNLHGFDEAFGGEGEGVDYVSYTLITAKSDAVRNMALSKLSLKEGEEDAALALLLGAKSVVASENNREALIGKGDAVLYVKAGFAITANQLKTFCSLF